MSVQFFFASEEVTLTVRNFLPAPPAHADPHTAGGGYGLRGMHERVQQAGGHLQINQIFAKTGSRDRSQAIVYAHQYRISPPDDGGNGHR